MSNIYQVGEEVEISSFEINEENIEFETSRILIVDNCLASRQHLKLKLEEFIPESLNIKIELVNSGEEAIHRLKHMTFDLVFLDVNIPGKNGYEVCALIKQANLPKVAELIGLSQAVDIQKNGITEFGYYIPKPLQDESLVNVVKNTFFWRKSPKL